MFLSTPFTASMKAAIFILLIGAVLGAVGWRYYQRTQNPTMGQRVEHLADKTRDAVAGKAEDLKLTPENIKEEVAKTGRVGRSKARIVGDRIGDARIVTVIKGKYVVDANLSALAINVDCRDGAVKLTGSATSPENIGRAVTLALATSGVHDVVSQLVIKN
jgi:osmotically-inducible protein OsmY